MSRRATLAICAPLAATLLLAGCDGEPVDTSGARYDLVWTWQAGAAVAQETGVYGTQGVEAAGNRPGARHSAVRWQDAAGDFWLFGGIGVGASDGTAAGPLHDLWRYRPATGRWTFMGGDTRVGGSSGHDGRGIYGTQGMADPANLPGARSEAQVWQDAAGDVWLFGGNGVDGHGTSGRLNDLWKYSGGLWTWIGGSDAIDQPGTYGVQGSADPTNWPGARYATTGWVDAAGVFWLFGGFGRDSVSGCCMLNDLWTFSGGEWTWVTGSLAAEASAEYGSQGVASAANTPSGRYRAASWHDSAGNTWLYGGVGNASLTDNTRFASAELWKYTSAGWMWVSGAKSAYDSPDYDTRGTASLAAQPGSRVRATAWIDAEDNLWLYGGDVEAASGSVSNPNDLWRYQAVAWTWMGGKNFNNPAGRYVSIGGGGQPGGRAGGAGWIDADGKLWLFGGDVTDVQRNDLWSILP